MTKYFQFCPHQNKVVPVEEVVRTVPATVAHGYIPDEMPPTRNPLNPKEIFTSKSKLREVYKAAGVVEVGTAYENGYKPERETSAGTDRLVKSFIQQVRERFNGN